MRHKSVTYDNLLRRTPLYRLLFFSAGSTSGVGYTGARDLESLDGFVKSNLDVVLPEPEVRLSLGVYNLFISFSLCYV